MKHASDSMEFYLQVKGFRHGAGGQPMDGANSDNPDYTKGYTDGQQAIRIYKECLCQEPVLDPGWTQLY